MSYQVSRNPENTVIRLFMDDVEAFRLEREDGGNGLWALYRITSNRKGPKLDRGRYSNDLIENVETGQYVNSDIRPIEGGLVVPVPDDCGEFYISGTGFLCAKNPIKHVIGNDPMSSLNVDLSQCVERATLEQKAAAQLPPEASAVFLREVAPAAKNQRGQRP